MTDSDREAVFRRVLKDSTGIILKIVRTFATGREDQDDLFQEIAAQIWTSTPSFRGDAKVTTWVYRVALNTAINWRRDERKRRQRHDFITDAARTTDGNPEEKQEMLAWLQRELTLLGPADRALMLLHLEGQSYRDISDVLGISESNVGVKLSRLRQRFCESARRTFDGF